MTAKLGVVNVQRSGDVWFRDPHGGQWVLRDFQLADNGQIRVRELGDTDTTHRAFLQGGAEASVIRCYELVTADERAAYMDAARLTRQWRSSAPASSIGVAPDAAKLLAAHRRPRYQPGDIPRS